jgi:hypothetical protein
MINLKPGSILFERGNTSSTLSVILKNDGKSIDVFEIRHYDKKELKYHEFNIPVSSFLSYSEKDIKRAGENNLIFFIKNIFEANKLENI